MNFHKVLEWALYSATVQERFSLLIALERLERSEQDPSKVVAHGYPPREAAPEVSPPSAPKYAPAGGAPDGWPSVMKEMREEHRHSTLVIGTYEPKSKAAKKWWKVLKASTDSMTARELSEQTKTKMKLISTTLSDLFKRKIVTRVPVLKDGAREYTYRVAK